MYNHRHFCHPLYGASVAHSFLCQGYGRRLEFCNARPIGEANNVGMASDEEYDGGSKRDDWAIGVEGGIGNWPDWLAEVLPEHKYTLLMDDSSDFTYFHRHILSTQPTTARVRFNWW